MTKLCSLSYLDKDSLDFSVWIRLAFGLCATPFNVRWAVDLLLLLLFFQKEKCSVCPYDA